MTGRPSPGREHPVRPGARGSLSFGGLAVLGGLVLAESLFLPWYSLDITVAGTEARSTHSGWQSMTLMDVLLFVAALVAIAAGVVLARRGELGLVVCAAGAAGVLMSLAGLIDLPDSDLAAMPGDDVAIGRRAGPFVALVASAGIAFAGFGSILRPWSPRPGSSRRRRVSRPRARAGSS
jgi:hypothetical protein